MGKSRNDKNRRNWIAVDAHFRNSAGEMKDKKLDKKLDRRRARQFEHEYDEYEDFQSF